MNFASPWNKLLKRCISVEFLLVKGYVQGALRKELLLAPFVERFKTATLGKSYWYILPVLGTIYLNIAFLPSFCWQKVKYKAFYEKRCSFPLAYSALKQLL